MNVRGRDNRKVIPLRAYFTAALVCVLAAAGFAAAALVAPAQASTGLGDLAGLGYSLGVRIDASASVMCPNYWVLSGNGAPETLLGDYNAKPGCNTAAELQARIDRLLADYPPRPTPVTETTTVTLPAVTVTTQAVTLPPSTVTVPAVTVTAPAETTTIRVAADPAPAQTVTRTQTVTATATVRDTSTDATIATLRVKLAQARATTERLRRASTRTQHRYRR